MNKLNSSTASTNNNSSRYHHQSNQDIQQQQQQYSHQQDNGVNGEIIYKTGNNEMVREPLNPVWNIAKPIQNLGKSAASMLMFTPEDRNSIPYPPSTTIIDPCTSSSTNHYSNNNNNNTNNTNNNNISSSRSNMHASPSEGTSSSCNNYMHQNMNQSSSYYHVSDTVQSVHDMTPTSNKSNYSYSSKERHTPSAIGSTINSQLLHTNRGVQINNFDIPSSNCHTEQVGKSFIQQHDQPVQTNQELKTNMTTSDIEFANNNYNTNRVSTMSSAGTINHQPQESNIDHANNTSNEFHNSSNSTNNNRRRTFNYNSTTLDHNMFNNNSPPPPPPLPSSSMNHQYYSSQYYPPPQQQQPSSNHSVIPPPILNNNNSKRISPSTVHYSSNTNNNESRFYDEKSRITTSSPQQHPQQHVESHVPYYKNSRHVSPTSTTYQYSSHHHQQQQHAQTPVTVVPSPRKVSRERPPYPDQVMSHSTPPQQQPYYPPSQQERLPDTPYSSNSGYQQITNNQTISNLSANFISTDSSFNGRNASHSGSSDDNSDSKLVQGGASDSSRKHKKKGPKKREISRDDMKKYFNVSQTVAARMLGVSVSTLKRRFYEEFNMKWPYVPSKTNTSKRKKEDGEAITGNDSQQNSDEQTSSHEMIQPPQFDSPYKKVKRDVVFENANQSHADSYQNYNNNHNYAPTYSQNERLTANSSHNGSVHTYSSIINKNIDNNASSGAVHHVRSENVSYVAPTRNNHVISYQHAEPYSPPSATTIRNNTGNNTLHSYHVPSPQVNHQNIRNANSPPGYMMRSEDVYSSSSNMIPTQPHQFTESTTASEPNMLPPISSFKMESWK